MPEWMVGSQSRPGADIRLFCFPYAGGGPAVFHKWAEDLPTSIEVCALQLPGRASRIREAPFTEVPGLVETLAEALRPELLKPFAFFGHSLGAIVAFELARLLRRQGQTLPAYLFVSGSQAPQQRYTQPLIHALPDADFIDRVRQWGGTPPEILAHLELVQLLLPMLRADFAVRETYEYTDEPPLACSIAGFGGRNDQRVTRKDVEAWQEQTYGEFSLHMLPGDHFFLHDPQPLLTIIARHLSE